MTFLYILLGAGILYGAYQIPEVRQVAKPYVDQAAEVLSNVKTEPTGTVIDRPELQTKD